MPGPSSSDDDFQRHGAFRDGREGRLQDDFGKHYVVKDVKQGKGSLQGDGHLHGLRIDQHTIRTHGLTCIDSCRLCRPYTG